MGPKPLTPDELIGANADSAAVAKLSDLLIDFPRLIPFTSEPFPESEPNPPLLKLPKLLLPAPMAPRLTTIGARNEFAEAAISEVVGCRRLI